MKLVAYKNPPYDLSLACDCREIPDEATPPPGFVPMTQAEVKAYYLQQIALGWVPVMPTVSNEVIKTALELIVDGLIATVNTKASQSSVDSKASQSAVDLKADINSPTLTGAPRVPTPATNDNSTLIPSTAHVKAAIAANTEGAKVTRSFVTTTSSQGFQISASKWSVVCYSITIITTATIGGNSVGTVFLEYCPTNSTTPGDWTEIQRITNGQEVSLAIALQSKNTQASVLTGFIPPGYYVRLRRDNGATSYTFNAGQELKM